MLKNIRIVLVQTSHPGNIGATARAMKNMGLSRLYLVDPLQFPSAAATARASSADDILEHAVVTESLEEAIRDCSVVIGTSAQTRGRPLTTLSPRESASWVLDFPVTEEIAIVFGTERSGLSNEDLAVCNRQIVIPTNADYSSLNLAQAVQIICYELYLAVLARSEVEPPKEYDRLANHEEFRQFYLHLEETLIDIHYLNPNVEKQLVTRLKRFFNRAGLEINELNIFRGIFNAAQGKKAKATQR